MNKWLTALMVLILVFIAANIFSSIFSDNENSFGDKIVVVPITGLIVVDGGEGSFFSEQSASSTRLVKEIRELNEDQTVKGIIFDINSPGGSAVASKEIADEIKKLDKPNYAVIREVGASGAYWIATATDRIIASPVSITGSIGVLGSYLEFSRLFDKYGVGYERLVGGKYKDLGSPYKSLSDEERALFQKKIDIIHEYFIQEVASNRNMDLDYVRTVSTGEFFIGQEAKELSLIDELGDMDTAAEMMKKEINLTEISVVREEEKISFIDILFSNSAYHFGRGFAKTLVEYDLSNKFEIRA